MLIALAVNPRAAFGRARHAGEDAAAHFRAAGADVLLLCEDSYAGLARAVDRALDSGVDALVVVGGDGMVHLGLNALAGAGAIAGARVEAGVADVAGAGTRASAGARGGIGGRVTADGECWQQGAMLISVANGQSIGGGMRITPGAVLDDGLLDLFIVSRVSRTGLLAVFPKVFSGRHVNHPAVHLRRVRKVELTAGNVVAYADGERIGALPLTIEVVPRAVRVLA
jgi:diacylglycerol kinase (ATP)